MSDDSHDWLSASTDDRKALYKTIKRVIDTTGLTWDELYARAIGRNQLRGIGYEDNFRAGKISRPNASRIHSWLASSHPEHAQSLSETLRNGSKAATSDPGLVPGERWQQFLQERATGAGVAVRKPPAAPIVQQLDSHDEDKDPGRTTFYRRAFADEFDARNPLVRVRLGEPFYFLFQTGAVGTVITLTEHRNQWMSERITESGKVPIFTDGENVIPSRGGEPRPLIEYDDAGLHRFVFVVMPGIGPLRHQPITAMGQAIPSSDLDELARELSALPTDGVRVFQVGLLFHAD